MQANRRRDTGPERELRSELHRRGLRFRVDLPLRLPDGRLVRPDVAFPGQRLAVFVDGCFWHRCPRHMSDPTLNADYWMPKLRANVERDRRSDEGLRTLGWRVVRIWEHHAPQEAAEIVIAALHPPAHQ